MILAITNTKGGVGKSTLSVNLATCFTYMGYKTIIIDVDDQHNSYDWAQIRPKEFPVFEVKTFDDPKSLRENINDIIDDYELIIIDGKPGLDDKMASTIMLLADVVLLVVKQGNFDVLTTKKLFDKLIRTQTLKREIKAYFLLSIFEPRTRSAKRTIEALEKIDLKILNTKIIKRTIYDDCIDRGLSVFEAKNKQAKQDIVNLTHEVLEILQENS